MGRSALTLGSSASRSSVQRGQSGHRDAAYQPNETPAGANTSADFKVNYQSLSVQLAWAVAVPARPKLLVGTYGCS